VYGNTAFTLTTVSTTGPDGNQSGPAPANLDAMPVPAAAAPLPATATDAVVLETASDSAGLLVVDEALLLAHGQPTPDEIFLA
jgi:hypothetical protein